MPASSKAIRLLTEGRVMPVGSAAAFRVQGDHATYDVAIGDGFAFCSCRAHGSCSHIAAARILQDALVDGIPAAMARHGREVTAA